MFYSDSNSIEKHPEEDISIVETLDNKEEGPDNIRSIVCANPRKKLYFNPDYFELELLMVNGNFIFSPLFFVTNPCNR